MATFNTVEELIQILDSDPQLLEALRSKLLTQELLDLPAAHAALVTEVQQLTAKVNQLAEEVQQLTAEIHKLVYRLDAIEHVQKSQADDIAELKGIGLESRLHNRGISHIATLLNVRNSRRIRVAEHDDNSVEFNDAIYDAQDQGVLSNYECDRLLSIDMIVLSNRRGSSQPVYVPIEASYSIAQADIMKVKQSADALGKVFPDADIRPVLYFMNISDNFTQVAQEEKIGLIQVERLSN